MGLIEVTPAVGTHCESTTLVNLLNQQGVRLSEAFVFGLGQGLSYIYWKSTAMDCPFIGGRIKPDQLTRNVARALDLKLQVRETQSEAKAWRNLTSEIDAGRLVGLKLDSFFLDYCHEDFHFAAHYVACYGYDDQRVYLIDSMDKSGVNSTSLESLKQARSFRGPMASKALCFTLTATGPLPELRDLIPEAIAQNAAAFLHPPIKNIGCEGIRKTSELMPGWLETLADPAKGLRTIATRLERAGTGGGNFRGLYASFLEECAALTGNRHYEEGALLYRDLSARWTEAALLIEKAGERQTAAPLEEASRVLAGLAEDEARAMNQLHAEATGARSGQTSRRTNVYA